MEWCRLEGERKREAGCNARLGSHGKFTPFFILQITIAGKTGFGWSRVTKEQAEKFLGVPVNQLFTDQGKVNSAYSDIEFPLLDWLGKMMDKPVYALFSDMEPSRSVEVPCYDTSLYFDDIHLEDDTEAVKLMQRQALEGWENGHRNFKIKVGRGGMQMPLEKGMMRDIAVIRGIRKAVGPSAYLMIDANNAYNVNLTKRVLTETADADVFWIEEPFHEDPDLFVVLKQWIGEQNLKVMLADGEGRAAPAIVDWAKKGVVDVIQYDIFQYGFSRWLELGKTLDQHDVKTAPHNYGRFFGNFASCHLAPSIKGFLFVEWDEVKVPGVDASSYSIKDGKVKVPRLPGFGLDLDKTYFAQKVQKDGWSVKE